MKKLAIVAIVAALLVPVTVTASQFSAARRGEQIVEGHTVFAVLEKKVQEQGFDIVIKVREVRRGPNVLWFNDQWKVFVEEVRQPCGGYVIATWAGVDPLAYLSRATIAVNGVTQPIFDTPVLDLDGDGVPETSVYDATGLRVTYVESYRITDPNAQVWITDLYAITGTAGRAIPVWISSVHNNEMDDNGDDDCAGIIDTAAHLDPGLNGVPYHDSEDGVPVREYNADIFGLWKDVIPMGATVHGDVYVAPQDLDGDGVPDTPAVGPFYNPQGTGCERGTQASASVPSPHSATSTEWGCNEAGTLPGWFHHNDDLGEGNSHPYNPVSTSPTILHVHENSRLDVFFYSTLGVFGTLGGYPPNPREFAVDDTEVVESEVSPCNVAGFYNHATPPSQCGNGIFEMDTTGQMI